MGEAQKQTTHQETKTTDESQAGEGRKKALNLRLVFFFRPSPSRLSPGRHTVFVLMNELDNA